MVDLSRRYFIKQSLKFSALTTAAIASYPITNLYQDKVSPVLTEKYPEFYFSTDMSFLQSISPSIIIGTSVMSFIMLYADQIEYFAVLLLAALSFLALGIPLTQYSLSQFI